MKKKLMFAALVVLTLAYAPLYLWLYQGYNAYVDSLLQRYPEGIRPYVDLFIPFWETYYGIAAVLIGTGILAVWSAFICTSVIRTHGSVEANH